MLNLIVGIFCFLCALFPICCLILGIKKGFGLGHAIIQLACAIVAGSMSILNFVWYFGSL